MTEHHKAIGDRIIRASLSVGLAHLSLKVLGYVQAIITGRYLDSADYDIVFGVAYQGIMAGIFFRLGEETIGTCLLPVFMQEKEQKSESAAWQLCNIVFTLQLILLVLTIGLVMLFPDFFLRLGTFWDVEVDKDKFDLARKSLVWVAPSLLFLSLGSTTYKILNGYKRFFLAAFGDASWKIVVIVALVVGMGILKYDYRVLVAALVVASLAKLLTHLAGLWRELRYLRLCFDFNNPAFKGLLLLMLPMLIGTMVSTARDYFNNVYVLTSLKEIDGLIKANDFGRKLFAALAWLVPFTASIAMFPFFCELVDKQDHKRLGELVTSSSRMLLAVFIPGALLLAAVSEPLALALFHGGKFDQTTAEWAAFSNACYVLVLPGYAVEQILMQAYLANRKMVSVTVIGIAMSILSISLSYYFVVQVKHPSPLYPLAVVSLSYVLTRSLKTVLLVILLRRTLPVFPGRATLLFLAQAVAVGLLCAGAAYAALRGCDHVMGAGVGKKLLLTKLVLASGVGAAVMLGAAWLVRLREPFTMMSWGVAKARGKLRGKGGAPPPQTGVEE